MINIAIFTYLSRYLENREFGIVQILPYIIIDFCDILETKEPKVPTGRYKNACKYKIISNNIYTKLTTNGLY